MPQQLWLAPLKRGNIAVGTAQNSFTQMTQISPIPDVVIPANTLDPGYAIKVKAAGRFGTNGTPTLQFNLYYGSVAAGVLLASSAAITTFTTANSSTFRAEWDIFVRTEGSTGSAFTSGDIAGITSTTQIAPIPVGGSGTTATINTTAATQLILAAAFSVQHGLNVVVVDQWQIVA